MIKLNNLDKVFIYTYGGVGSVSLHETMKAAENVIHTHVDDFLVKQVKKNEKTLVISVARNLFDRNISHFFEQFKKQPQATVDEGWFYNYRWHDHRPLKGSWREFENDAKECYIPFSTLKENKALAQEHFSIFNKIQNKKLENWFESLNSILNTNVFNKPFDFENKYSIHTAGNVTILTLRFEDIQYWQSIFDKILTPSPILKEKNKSSEKWYYDIYRQFKKDYKYSKDNIDLMSNMKRMKFYYKKDELNSIIKKYK